MLHALGHWANNYDLVSCVCFEQVLVQESWGVNNLFATASGIVLDYTVVSFALGIVDQLLGTNTTTVLG
jgi:hypothetical protein